MEQPAHEQLAPHEQESPHMLMVGMVLVLVLVLDKFFLEGNRQAKVANRPWRHGSTVNEPDVGFIAAKYCTS